MMDQKGHTCKEIFHGKLLNGVAKKIACILRSLFPEQNINKEISSGMGVNPLAAITHMLEDQYGSLRYAFKFAEL